MHNELMTTNFATTQLRVDAGMEFLDRKTPGWENYIDLPNLELSDGCRCILGQIGQNKYGLLNETITGYGMLVGELYIDVNVQENLGFFCSNPFNYELLTEVWRDKIKERLTTKTPKIYNTYTNVLHDEVTNVSFPGLVV